MANVIDMLKPSPAIAARHASKLAEIGQARALAEWLALQQIDEARNDERRRAHLEARLIRDMKIIAAHALAVGDIAWGRALIARISAESLGELDREPADPIHIGEHS